MNPYIERLNYYRDERTRGPIEKPVLYHEDGYEEELPCTWVVCPRCNGEGTHVNPSIDAGGLSSEDFYEDPDFAEDYMSGVYDVPCSGCGGRTTVQGLDWDALDDVTREAYERQLEEEAAAEACRRAELSLGC
jgi:hypothetical protein